MKVWIFAELKYVNVGAIRWSVSWWTLRAEARGKEEPDFDTDLEENIVARSTHEIALKLAQNVARHSYFGVAMLQQQRASMIHDSFGANGEWSDVGRAEEVVA